MSCRSYRGPMCNNPVSVRAVMDLRPYVIVGMLRKSMRILLTFIILTFLLCPVMARATTLVIPRVSAVPGNVVEIPVKIDQIENLAGIKLVLSYDKTTLTYVKAVKAEAASSLMHVVNDKKPGQLIIVMAGARGIKGADMTLMTLTFTVNPALSESITQTEIAVKEIQIMDDRLKELKCEIKSGGVGIVREKMTDKLHGGEK